MKRLLLALLVLLLLAAPARADNGFVVHKVKAGDTLELLAAEYYGDRNHAVFIMVANKLDHPRPLKPGERIKIPVSREITASVGDTLESLAATYLDDKRRGPFLAEFNGLAADDTVAAGAVLSIPFNVTHTAAGEESLASIATAYFGDAKNATLLRDYNFLDRDGLHPGDTIVVPIIHVRVRPSKLPPLDAESRARTERRRRTEDSARDAVPQARAAWRTGDFATVKKLLTTLDIDYLDTSLAVEIGVLLGATYVAYGDDDSALATFKRVLERRPKQVLDPYLFSPKILAVWKLAGGATE